MTGGLTTWLRSVVVCFAALALLGFVSAPTAFAHTDFDFSLPTDGAFVGDPVSEIRVAFTTPVTLVGNGFEVLDPQGEIRQPFAVTDDDTLFRLQMDPPLAGGDVGVRWEVRAEDGHVLSGSFSFTVDSPPPTTAPPTTVPPPTTLAPPTTVSPTVVVGSTAAAAITTVDDVTAATPTVPVADDSAASDPTSPSVTQAPIETAAADGSPGSSSSAIVVGAIVVAVLAGGFLVVRSRSSANA